MSLYFACFRSTTHGLLDQVKECTGGMDGTELVIVFLGVGVVIGLGGTGMADGIGGTFGPLAPLTKATAFPSSSRKNLFE
jgi:hypothetical protein